MDEIRVRELPQKGSAISLSDMFIVEDEDGTKTVEASILKSLLQQSIFYDTVEDMRSATLNEGDIIRTLGYRSPGDGGGAYYKIEYAPTDIEDGIYIHYLHTSDTLRAHYICTDNDINISQAGAFGDGITDDFTLIQKMLDTGAMVAVPRRTYKVTGSLDVPSGTTIDLNGATILCPNSAAFCIGLDHEARNITIKNGKFVGVNGIELYTMASEIIITNCEFYGSGTNTMSKGIFINGASNVQIDNVKIGTIGSNEVRYGIYVSNGTGEDGFMHYNYNIQMSNLSIISSMAGIAFSGTFVDKNISVVDFSIEGYSKNATDTYGVLIGSNADSIGLSNGKIKDVGTGICISGIITATVSCTDIMVDNSQIMYDFASAGSTVYLYGIHRFTGKEDGLSYVFDRITSKIILQGEFDGDREVSDSSNVIKCKTSMVGELVDVVSPVNRKAINITSLDVLNNENIGNKIPGYKNVSLNLEFSGTISEIRFPSLSGQVIALYSDASQCVLTQSTKLRVPSDITLSRYEPVLLRNDSGIWRMVQYGGSSDGSSSGSSGGSSSGGGTVVIEELEPLTVYFGENDTKACTYNGNSPKSLYIKPSNIGAAKSSHQHATSDIKGLSDIIPKKLPAEYPLKISINGGSTEGVDYFIYDGSAEKTINIAATGGGSGSVDLSAYGTKYNFEGSGHFSVNRKEFTDKGEYSVAIGRETTASAIGAIAIGHETIADGMHALALGNNTQASAESSTAKGFGTIALGRYSETSGHDTTANGEASYTMGTGTVASGSNQLALGRYNTEDSDGKYIIIAGAGASASNRKNVHTLDWEGNAVYTGTVSVATPTKDNHAATKKYTDDLNANLDTKILEASNSIKEIIADKKGFSKACYTVTDWDELDTNGFVMGVGANNAPPSQQSSLLLGISILNIIETKNSNTGVVTTRVEDGLVVLYSVYDTFENLDSKSSTVTFPVYMRQCSAGSWGEWFKMYIGQGEYDVNEGAVD